MMEDQRDILRTQPPFSWKLLKSSKALIYWNKKLIKTIKGKEYNKLVQLIQQGDAYNIQLFLAKITGNFKHGNEKKNT